MVSSPVPYFPSGPSPCSSSCVTRPPLCVSAMRKGSSEESAGVPLSGKFALANKLCSTSGAPLGAPFPTITIASKNWCSSPTRPGKTITPGFFGNSSPLPPCGMPEASPSGPTGVSMIGNTVGTSIPGELTEGMPITGRGSVIPTAGNATGMLMVCAVEVVPMPTVKLNAR